MVFEAACGLLNHGPSRFDRKRGQRELAGEFSETDFESEVFEFACKLGRRPSRFDPSRGQREVAGDFFVPNPKDMLFHAAFGFFERSRRLSETFVISALVHLRNSGSAERCPSRS